MPTSDEVPVERKPLSDARAKQVMLEALRGKGGQLTRADAVALSGLPVPAAEAALTSLLKDYRSHLAATESGELLYTFDPAFERRDAEGLSEKLAKLGRALWQGFTWLFKVSILVTLVAYFAIFVAMMLVLVFARRSGERSDRRDDDGGFDFAWPLFWMWGWQPAGPAPYRRRTRGDDRPLYKKVFAFVFGPPRPAPDPLLDDKEILAYIREQRGRIAAVDLVALMGWTFPRADEEATRLLIDYGGEPEVSDDGVVLFVFKDIRKTAQARGAAGVRPRRAWERTEHRPAASGNSPALDAAISLFNGFNLLAPFWIVPSFAARLGVPLGDSFWLSTYPVLFSSMVFAVPLARWLVERVRDRGRRQRNVQRQLLRTALQAQGQPLPREQLAKDTFAAKVLDASLVRFGGDVVVDDGGGIRYAFPRIGEELAAVARARARAASSEEDPGAVVFSSQ